MKQMKIAITIVALLFFLSGCASKSELQKSPCACEPDQRMGYERV